MSSLVDMETESAENIISKVLKRFASADEQQRKWTNLDTNMEHLEYLDDTQLVKEAKMSYERLQSGTPQCKYDHKGSPCFVPTIMVAIGHVLDQYAKVPVMSPERRYVLRYFVALVFIKEIFSK